MKITRRQLRKIIREAQHGMQYPRGSQPPLDVPMRDSGPVPKDQLRKLADIYMKDMGMSASEVLGTPEFVEKGITDLRQLDESFHSMSPAGKSLANSIKGKFMRMYPDAKVGIDGRGGFITVNGVKAVDMSQATGRRMTDEEMIEKMHAAYAGTHVDSDVPTADSRMRTFREGRMKITKKQLRKIIKEELQRLNESAANSKMAQRLRDFKESGYTEEEAAQEVYEDYDTIEFLRKIAAETKDTDPDFSSYVYEVAYQAGEIRSDGSTMFDEPDRDGGSRYRRYMGY